MSNLSPEYVDYESQDVVKIGFVDENVHPVMEIILTENNAFNLGTMLLEQTSLKAKRERNQFGSA